MNLPGFTAAASLYQRDERYQETIAARHSNANAVQPASCIGNCFQDCMSYPGWPKAACMSYCRWECAHPGF